MRLIDCLSNTYYKIGNVVHAIFFQKFDEGRPDDGPTAVLGGRPIGFGIADPKTHNLGGLELHRPMRLK